MLMSWEGMGSARKATWRKTNMSRAVSWRFLHSPSVTPLTFSFTLHTLQHNYSSLRAFLLSIYFEPVLTSSQPVISLNHENSPVR